MKAGLKNFNPGNCPLMAGSGLEKVGLRAQQPGQRFVGQARSSPQTGRLHPFENSGIEIEMKTTFHLRQLNVPKASEKNRFIRSDLSEAALKTDERPVKYF